MNLEEESKNVRVNEYGSTGYKYFAAQDDEIDFVHIGKIVNQEKKILILSITVFLVLGFIYIFSAPVKFRSVFYIEPPLQEDVMEAFVWNSDIKGSFSSKNDTETVVQHLINPNELFNMYVQNLKSKKIIQLISENHKENKILEVLEKNLEIKQFEKDGGVIAELTMDTSPKLVNETLAELVALANVKAIAQYKDMFEAQSKKASKDILEKISKLRITAKNSRLNHIAQLEEAISVAKKLKIISASEIVSKISNQSVLAENIPTYHLGSKLLEEERAVLLNRKNDDPYIPDVKNWQDQLEIIKQTHAKTDFPTYRVEVKTDTVVKVNKKIIIIVSAFLGIVIGMMLIYVKYAFKKT